MYITMEKTIILEKEQRFHINNEGKSYFVGKDLCKAMDYKNHNSILKKYVSDKNRQKVSIATNKGVQAATLLNENGVLELLSHSCKPYAEKFKELLLHQSFIQIIKGYQEVSNKNDHRGKQEVSVQDNSKEYQEVHEPPVPAVDLYKFSESDKPFTEWLLQATLYHSYQKDYFVNDNEEVFFRNEVAKEIMIQQNNKKGKMYRQSLINAEKERNELRKELYQSDSMNMINNSIQQATEYIEQNQRGIKGYIT